MVIIYYMSARAKIINVSTNQRCIYLCSSDTRVSTRHLWRAIFFFDKLPNTKGGQLGHTHTSVALAFRATHPRYRVHNKNNNVYAYINTLCVMCVHYYYISCSSSLFIIICDICTR